MERGVQLDTPINLGTARNPRRVMVFCDSGSGSRATGDHDGDPTRLLRHGVKALDPIAANCMITRLRAVKLMARAEYEAFAIGTFPRPYGTLDYNNKYIVPAADSVLMQEPGWYMRRCDEFQTPDDQVKNSQPCVVNAVRKLRTIHAVRNIMPGDEIIVRFDRTPDDGKPAMPSQQVVDDVAATVPTDEEIIRAGFVAERRSLGITGIFKVCAVCCQAFPCISWKDRHWQAMQRHEEADPIRRKQLMDGGRNELRTMDRARIVLRGGAGSAATLDLRIPISGP
jgi:hypothetical protein